jgi:predicted transcriptional regulator
MLVFKRFLTQGTNLTDSSPPAAWRLACGWNPGQSTNSLVTFFKPPRLSAMPPKPSATLTEAELRLMEVLWRQGPSSVQQVLEGLPGGPALAYNSVLTTIRILEKKGYVGHSKDGRAHVYAPLVERSEATRSEVKHLVQRLFQNSHELLVLNVLAEADFSADELQRLRRYLKERE